MPLTSNRRRQFILSGAIIIGDGLVPIIFGVSEQTQKVSNFC